MYTLTGMLVFLIPFPRLTALYESALYTALALALYLLASRKQVFSLDSPLTIPFAVFLAWISLGLFFALDPLNSMKDMYGHYIKYLLLYFLIINSFTSFRDILSLSWIIAAGGGLFAWSAILRHYVFSQNLLSSRLGDPAILGLSSGYIGYVTIPGFLLSLTLFQDSLSARGKIIAVILTLGSACATLLTQSRAAFVASLCSLAILYSRKRAALAVAVLVIFSLIYFLPAPSGRFAITKFTNNERIGIYLTTWHVIRDYPVAGIGFGMQTYGNPELVDLDSYNRQVSPAHQQPAPIVRAPHNTLLDTMVRTGVIGLLIYVYMQFVFLRMGWIVIRRSRDHRVKKMGICVLSVYGAIFIQGMFSDGAFGPQALMLYFAFALMTILWKIVDSDLNRQVSATTTTNKA